MAAAIPPRPPSSSFLPGQFSVADKAAQKYVGSRHKVAMAEISSLAPHVGRLFGVLDSQGVQATGAPLFRYRSVPHNMDAAQARFDIDVGIPVADDAHVNDLGADAGVIVDTLPAGRYLEMVYIGNPSTLGRATKALLDHAQSQDLTFDVQRGNEADTWPGRVEWYETDPNEQPDMDKWVNRISIRLAE